MAEVDSDADDKGGLAMDGAVTTVQVFGGPQGLVASIPSGEPSTLESALRCARPMLFEGSDESHPYWGNGSGFLAALHNFWFLFTAEHVVKHIGKDALRIFANDHTNVTLPFDARSVWRLEDPRDTDLQDVRCHRVADAITKPPEGTRILGFNLKIPPAELYRGDELKICGYPGEFRSIDYEKAEIFARSHVLDGVLVGPSVSTNCFEMRVTNARGISSLDGLSGSPVLRIPGGRGDHQNLRLAGMVLRGGLATVHFVGASVIERMAHQGMMAWFHASGAFRKGRRS